MIRPQLARLVKEAILTAQRAGDLPPFDLPEVLMDRPQRPEWGDFSSPIAMKLASVARRSPMQIAQAIVKHAAPEAAVAKIEVVAPGFINFGLSPAWLAQQVERINAAGGRFGDIDLGAGKSVQVEHVSANPTGPLHVGSARNGAIGDSLARILRAAGYQVQTEYYINDAGSQIRHYGESIYARYAQAAGRDEPFPEDGYKGTYVTELGRALFEREGARYLEIPREEAIRALGRLGTDRVIEDARVTLARMRVEFDNWFSEKSLYDSGLFENVFGILQAQGLTYESQGATWFAATKLGLDKDAVLIRSADVIPDPRERPTYLASDVAYVWNKLVERQFDRAIYVWGADHQGDVPRVQAVTRALGLDPARVVLLIYQHVLLKSGGEAVRMSKRSGEYVTIDELLDDIGADAVRFFLITRSADTALELDLEMAKKRSKENPKENPVFYVQYQHARIASILRNGNEMGLTAEGGDVALLQHPAELDLIRLLLEFEEVVELAAACLEPHHLPHYALELASTFSQFYEKCKVLNPEAAAISQARLKLVRATKQVLARTLDLMGVSAPESM